MTLSWSSGFRTGSERLLIDDLVDEFCVGLSEEETDRWPSEHVEGIDGDPVPFHLGQQWAWESNERYIAMICGTQSGKALSVDTAIPTPSGFVMMGDLDVGNTVFDLRGYPCRVTAVTPTQYNRRCYRITFDDGVSIIADADHRWVTQTYKERKNEARRKGDDDPRCKPTFRVRTTEEIAATVYDRRGASNHSIDMPDPAEYPERRLPIPPYTLGAWLGDGSSSGSKIYVADAEIVATILSEGIDVEFVDQPERQGKAITYYLGKVGKSRDPSTGQYVPNDSIKSKLSTLGLIGDKHIPEEYLTASSDQRLSLLRGLMDTDGSCSKRGRCEFSSTNERLALGVLELCRSLGIKTRWAEGRAKLDGEDKGPKYRISFTTDVKVFMVDRKRERQPDWGTCRPDVYRRYIRSVEPVESVPVRCISVNSASHQYLATRSYIPTHNTTFGPWWLWREIKRMGPGDYLAITATYKLFSMKMLPTIMRVFRDILEVGRWWAGDRMLELRPSPYHPWVAERSTDTEHMWGRLMLHNADAKGGLEAGTIKAVWCDEAGQDRFKAAAWKGIKRRIALHQSRVLITTTLYNLGYVKQQFIDKAENADDVDVTHLEIPRGPVDAEADKTVSKEESICLIQYDSIINPIYPVEEYLDAMGEEADDEFMMQWRGRVAKLRTLIYDVFDVQIHKVPSFPIPSHWPRFAGVDPRGGKVAALWLALDPDKGQIHAYREYAEPFGITTSEHVKNMLTLSRQERVQKWTGGGPGERQERVDFQGSGLPLHAPEVTEVWTGIDIVYALLKKFRLVVHDSCEELLDEFGSYQRVRGSDGEIKMREIKNKEDYHLLDCLRYGLIGVVVPGETSHVVDMNVTIGPNW